MLLAFPLRFVFLLVLVSQIKADSAPPANDYFRRLGHGIVIIGNYLYLHGGQISWDLGNGSCPGQAGANTDSYRVNETLAIPLTESWTNDTIPWIRLPNTNAAPVMNRPALWPDGDSFFAWGGSTPFFAPNASALWRFTSNGSGGGDWNVQEPGDVDTFSHLVRSAGASRATCKGVGVYFGGYANTQTDVSFKGINGLIPVPGILTYEFETGIWRNNSANSSLNSYGTSGYGSATCLEDYGAKGVFLPLGGDLMPDLRRWDDNGRNIIETNVLSLYDVERDRWLQQSISGEAPPRRDRACITSARSQNGSVDIYMYGGLRYKGSSLGNEVFEDVWVLSIPAFAWFKLDVNGTKRGWNECVIVGSQLLSIGGIGKTLSFQERDEWRQGVGVLDLTTMTWADSFNPDSTAYDSPQFVKDWYRNNDLRNINWTSNDVKALFTSQTNGTNSTDASVATKMNNQKTPIGSIVGGIVGGVVALAAILGFGFWYLRKQRSKNSKTATASEAPNEETKENSLPHTVETHTQQWYYAELNGRPGLFQLPIEGSERPAELGPHADAHIPIESRRGISELAGSSPVKEK